MTIISAYQDTGTYRGAAAICGTTPKTVKRVIERAQAGGVRPAPKQRARNFEVVADLVAERVKKSTGRIIGQAVAARRTHCRVRRVGSELPPAGRAGQEGLAGRAPPGPPPGGVVPG